MDSLTGKIALVTGASRGLGKGIALELAKAGAEVIVNYRSGKNEADCAVNEIISNNGKAVTFGADVSETEDVKKLFDFIREKYGRLDILVNCAGITKDNLLLRMSENDWDAVIAVNLKGSYNFIKAASRPMMKARYGKIVNISSVVGRAGNAGQINYSASKAGVIGMTKSVAKELGSRNIFANAVAPGYIVTDMTRALPEEARKAFEDFIPLKRPGKPEDVADVVYFLCSPLSDYVTGQVINVCGGFLM